MEENKEVNKPEKQTIIVMKVFFCVVLGIFAIFTLWITLYQINEWHGKYKILSDASNKKMEDVSSIFSSVMDMYTHSKNLFCYHYNSRFWNSCSAKYYTSRNEFSSCCTY